MRPRPLILFLGLLIVGYMAYGGFQSRSSTPEMTRGFSTSTEARLACERFVADRLRAPSTARFSPDARAVANVTDRWVVNGWVDSQNGFGAQLRSDYECAVTLTGTGWRLDNFSLTER